MINKLDKKRFRVRHCPCGKSNKDGKFVPYINYENKGYCHSCGETFLPELPQQRFQCFHRFQFPHTETRKRETKVSFIPFEPFKKSLNQYNKNNFVQYLLKLFGTAITQQLISQYFIGTSKHWNGATIFWQIDTAKNIRTGKIMLYNSDTGKRSKYFTFVHKLLKIENYKQSFFGEHLLNLPENKNKIVAIFESEKTAVIASVYFPEMICLGAGGKHGLSPEKCKALQGRSVILYPDLSKPKPGKPSAFELWSVKAKELSRLFPRTRFAVSDLLERHATKAEREQGLDLADFLIRYDYRDFQHCRQPEHQQQTFEQPQPNKMSFIGISGKFYIQNPVDKNRFAVYESTEAYNKRLHLPDYISKEEAEKDFKKFLPIDLKILTTISMN